MQAAKHKNASDQHNGFIVIVNIKDGKKKALCRIEKQSAYDI